MTTKRKGSVEVQEAEPAPVIDESTDGVAEDVPSSPEPDQGDETGRADALAKLAGDTKGSVEVQEAEPAPVPVEHSGRFVDLSDSDDGSLYIVTKSKVSYRVRGNYRVARRGDQIRLSDEQAARGLRIGSIARYEI